MNTANNSQCKEHDLSKVVSATAYRVSAIPPVAHPYLYIPSLTKEQLYNEEEAPRPDSGVVRLQFNKGTLKCSDKTIRDTDGLRHDVDITWEAALDTTGEKEYDDLIEMLSNPHFVIFTYIGGQQTVALVDPDTYLFDYEHKDGVTSYSLSATNAQGLIPVVG